MAHEWAKGLTATFLLGGLFYAVTKVPRGDLDAASSDLRPLEGIAEALFQAPWLFAFEFLSLLLLAALFGSLWLAAKEPDAEADEA